MFDYSDRLKETRSLMKNNGKYEKNKEIEDNEVKD